MQKFSKFQFNQLNFSNSFFPIGEQGFNGAEGPPGIPGPRGFDGKFPVFINK